MVDNQNEKVNGDWVTPLIQKYIIHEKLIFQFNSKYIYKMSEGELEIKQL